MNKIVSISFDCPECEEVFKKLLSSLPDAGERPENKYRVVKSNRTILVCDDEKEILRAESPIEACYCLEQHILYYHLFKQENENLVFHSAALRHNKSEMIVFIMGAPRCGKTSITLAALKSGKFIYLSEDCVALAPFTFDTIPFPRSLRYRGRSGKDLNNLNGWETFPLPNYPVSILFPPGFLLTNKKREPAPSLAIFPVFSDKSQLKARTLTRGEILAKLITLCTNNHDFLRKNGLKELNILAQKLMAVEVFWNDPDQVIPVIESLLGQC